MAVVLTSCQSFYTTDQAGVATINVNEFRLPPEIEGFKRVYITSFDARGHNVGSGYNYYSSTQKNALTVYVVSSPDGRNPTADEQSNYFQLSRQEVNKAHKNTKEVNVSKVQGHGAYGSVVEFRYDEVFAHSHQRVASFLGVFVDSNRLIKYRITGPESQRDVIYSSLLEAIKVLSKAN